MAEHSQSNASMEGGLGGALGGGRGAVGGTVTPPPPSFGGPLRQRIFFVCFHLPVVVGRHQPARLSITIPATAPGGAH